jgi:hypothetical protein
MSGTSSQFPIDNVEAALIALLSATIAPELPAAYGTPDESIAVDVDSTNQRDFNGSGQLVLKPPSIRVEFGDASFSNLRDNQRLTYESGLLFDVLCYERNLRSKAEARLKTLILVRVVLNQLAGARLALADGTSSMPLELRGVSLVLPDDDGPVDQLFAVHVLVKGIAQFDGPNARFGQ